MQVSCEKTEWYLLSPRDVANGKDMMTKYEGASMGQTYSVYGVIMYENSLKYLLFDAYGMPNWYPAEIFAVIDSRMPANWHFAFYGSDNSLTAIWGYEELVISETHYDELCEQEPTALSLFNRRKLEMDAQ